MPNVIRATVHAWHAIGMKWSTTPPNTPVLPPFFRILSPPVLSKLPLQFFPKMTPDTPQFFPNPTNTSSSPYFSSTIKKVLLFFLVCKHFLSYICKQVGVTWLATYCFTVIEEVTSYASSTSCGFDTKRDDRLTHHFPKGGQGGGGGGEREELQENNNKIING